MLSFIVKFFQKARNHVRINKSNNIASLPSIPLERKPNPRSMGSFIWFCCTIYLLPKAIFTSHGYFHSWPQCIGKSSRRIKIAQLVLPPPNREWLPGSKHGLREKTTGALWLNWSTFSPNRLTKSGMQSKVRHIWVYQSY